jgi:HEAT repeat protein
MTPLWLHITVFLLFCFFWQYFGYQKKKSIEAFQRIGKSPNNSYSIAGYKISIERAARRLDENDWRFLEQCLTHPDLQVAAWASGALSKLEDSRAVEILMNHIQRLDEEISSSKTTKSAQSNFISSPEPGINQSIHWNFIHSAIIENEDQLSREYSFPPLNQQSPGILRDFLQRIADDNSQKEAIRFHALESMKSLVDPPPQHFLESLLESNEPLVLQGTLSLVGFSKSQPVRKEQFIC